MKKLITLAVAAALLPAIPALAQPEADADTYVVSVPYGDLNLASAAGARTLDNRLKAVAKRLCGVEQAPGLVEMTRVHGCREDVLGSAQSQISQALAMRGTGSVSLAASR